MHLPVLIATGLALVLAGCSSARETSPQRTATEQLLISRAADDAAGALDLSLPEGALIYLEPGNLEGSDGVYALGAIRDRLLRDGARLTRERSDAEIVVMVRAGALSIDESKFLVGIPEFDLPIPLAGDFTFPELALFMEDRRVGVAKFAASAIDARDGRLISATDPRFGYSQSLRWVALFVVSGTSDNLVPDPKQDRRRQSVVPELPGLP